MAVFKQNDSRNLTSGRVMPELIYLAERVIEKRERQKSSVMNTTTNELASQNLSSTGTNFAKKGMDPALTIDHSNHKQTPKQTKRTQIQNSKRSKVAQLSSA